MHLSLVRRRFLRRNPTPAEAALWSELRARRMAGFKFRRQHPCGPYILDCYCAEARLAIELDGGQRFEEATALCDEERTAFVRERGIEVLRFANDVVFSDRLAVLERIAAARGVGEPCPSPSPSPLRGEGIEVAERGSSSQPGISSQPGWNRWLASRRAARRAPWRARR
jgi:very-short-patch-repair endonuclease